jgi:hypothetical protein
VKAALEYVQGLAFRPAIADGKPAATSVVQPVAFRAENKWVAVLSAEFRAEMATVEELFDKRDFAGADFHAEWMLREKVRYGYEYAALQAQLAQTRALIGDEERALKNAEEATQSTAPRPGKFVVRQDIPPNDVANYLLPRDLVVQLLGLRMQLGAKLGRLADTLTAYYELAGLVTIAPDDPRAELAAFIMAKLESDEPLMVKGSTGATAWSFRLTRGRFSLDRVQGSIRSMQLACGQKRRDLQVSPNKDWTVPAGWEDCATVIINADPGTTFSLVERAN